MTAILQKWLSMRLNLTLKWKPEEFGLAVRDGVIIAKLLENYNVISKEQLQSIIPSNDLDQIKNNLLKISNWLKNINIQINNDDIKVMSQGKGSIILKLFYQMFLELDGKDKIYYISKNMNNSTNAHDVQNNVERRYSNYPEDPISQMASKRNYLKYEYKADMNGKEQINSTENVSLNKDKISCESLNYTYSELKNFENTFSKSQNDRRKLESKNDSMNIESKTESIILTKMTKQCVQKNKEKKDVKMLLELSNQEKHIVKELLEAKHETSQIIKSRMKQQEEITKKRRIEFSKAMDNIKYQVKQQAEQLEFEKEILSLFDKKIDVLNSKDRANYCALLSICKDTLDALINYAFKVIEFYEVSEDIPEQYLTSWKALFIYGKPEEECVSEEIEQRKEEERNILDEADLSNYLNNDINTCNIQSDQTNCENAEFSGYHILGYVVNKVLMEKYPKPQTLQHSVSRKPVATILLNSFKLSDDQYFKNLICDKNILIIHVTHAIALCLEDLKKEMIEFDEYNSDFEQLEMELKKMSTLEIETESLSTLDELDTNKIFANKKTQTPRKLPLLDVYSESAEIGKQLYDTLKDGKCISDELLALSMMNYLHNNIDFDGWVFIDYPKNFDQAKILEELLTGKPVTLNEELIEKELSMNVKCIDETTIPKSRIAPFQKQPSVKKDEFDTYFTSFIKLKQSECIANEDFIWNLTEKNSSLIERFYAYQGINYSIYFEQYDETTISAIVKYILGDIELLPSRASNNSIGSQNVDNSKIKILQNKPLSSVMSFKTSSLLFEIGLKEQLMNNVNKAIVSSQILNSNTSVNLYEDYFLPQEKAAILASFWEDLESVYILDLKEAFFDKRIIFFEIIPYISCIRERLKPNIEDDETPQDIISSLQNEFALVIENSQKVDNFKADLYCRIKEMEIELEEHFSKKKLHYNNTRNAIIDEEWVTRNLEILTNIYVNMMQIELNRTDSILKFIFEYYNEILGTIPSKDIIKPFQLTKMSLETFDTIEDNSKKIAERENTISTFMKSKLLNNEDISTDENPFINFINNCHDSAEQYLKTIESFYTICMEKEKNKLNKPANNKISKKKSIENSLTSKINLNNVVTEWEMVFRGEICRLKRQLQTLKYKATEELNQFKQYIVEVFCEAFKGITNNEIRDIETTEMIVKLFTLALEKDIPIPIPLFYSSENIQNDLNEAIRLIHEKDSLKFLQTCDFPIGQLATLRRKLMFIAKHCSIPKNILVIVLQDFFLLNEYQYHVNNSHSWNLLQPCDFYRLIDEIYGDIYYVDWRDFIILCMDLNFPDVHELIKLRNEFMELDTLHDETISRENYTNVKFWFESEKNCSSNHHILHSCLAKELLFLLFETSNDVMNYSAFLFAFCKSHIPKEGFASALSIAMGKLLCTDKSHGEVIADIYLEKINVRNQLQQSAISCAENLVTDIVDHTVRICSGVNISDIITPTSSSECFNKKYIGIIPKPMHDELKSKRTSSILNKSRSSNISAEINLSTHSEKKDEIDKETDTDIKEDTEDVVYTISEDIVKRILVASLPWHCRTQFATPFADIIYGLHRTFAELKYDSDSDEVFTHHLLEHPFIKDFLYIIHKFKLTKPCQIVAEIIFNRENSL